MSETMVAVKECGDRTGKVFYHMTVLRRHVVDGVPALYHRRTVWVCQCVCGKIRYVNTDDMKGRVKSCGCIRQVKHKNRKPHIRSYVSWQSMMRRCTLPTDPGYPNYGGRGIAICERWHTFDNFLADMGDRPTGHTLDRIDNNGNYCPENCRWATPLVQGNNKTNNVRIERDGVEKTMSDWIRELGGTRAEYVYARDQYYKKNKRRFEDVFVRTLERIAT